MCLYVCLYVLYHSCNKSTILHGKERMWSPRKKRKQKSKKKLEITCVWKSGSARVGSWLQAEGLLHRRTAASITPQAKRIDHFSSEKLGQNSFWGPCKITLHSLVGLTCWRETVAYTHLTFLLFLKCENLTARQTGRMFSCRSYHHFSHISKVST